MVRSTNVKPTSSSNSSPRGDSIRRNFPLLAVLLLTSLAVNRLLSAASAGEVKTKKLVTTIDCTKEYGPDTYFGFGDIRVTRSVAGAYREAGADSGSRFGYPCRKKKLRVQ